MGGSNCYKYVNADLPWEKAKERCHTLHGWLAEPMSDVENEYVKETMRLAGNHGGIRVWLGGNDKQQENTWVWDHSKKPITRTGFIDWNPGQPDFGTNENCMEMSKVSSHIKATYHGQGWNDNECDHYTHFVCQTDATLG